MTTKNRPNKTPKQIKLAGFNFKYCLHVDYETEYHHEEDREDDYCRCSTLHNAHIEKVNLKEVIGYFLKVSKLGGNLSEINQYCIDRIFHINKLWETDFFEIQIDHGYYGQEIGSVTVEPKKAPWIDYQIQEVLNLKSSKDKIEYILKLEYGYLIDSLKGMVYEIKMIDKDSISFQKEHYYKLDQDAVLSYVGYKFPKGICIMTSQDHYRLIDGYTRVAASKDSKIRMLVAKAP